MAISFVPSPNQASSTPTAPPPYKKLFIATSISTILLTIILGYSLYQNKSATNTSPKIPNAQKLIPSTPPITPSHTPIPKPTASYSRIGVCTKDQCLFSGYEAPEGFAYLTGYYTSYKSEDWGTPTTCDGFVVTGGNNTLINHFNEWINKGNGLNKRINGNLVTNLTLDTANEKIIKSSNKNDQVNIGVIRVSPRGMGASTCTPVIQIITVNQVKTPIN